MALLKIAMGVALLVGSVNMVVVVVSVSVLTSVRLLSLRSFLILGILRLRVSLRLFKGLAVVAVGISGAHRCRSEKNVNVNVGWLVGI